MKKIVFLVLLLAGKGAYAQCGRATTWVFSFAPGYAKTGITFNMEGGLWPVNSRFGVIAGPVIYSQQKVIKGITEQVTDVDFTGRVVFKLTRLDSDFPQLITLFSTVGRNLGASYRGYISLTDNHIIGIEPFYGTKTGIGVSAIFTVKL